MTDKPEQKDKEKIGQPQETEETDIENVHELDDTYNYGEGEGTYGKADQRDPEDTEDRGIGGSNGGEGVDDRNINENPNQVGSSEKDKYKEDED